MTEDKFINAMNTLDDDLLIEAMAETPAIISSGARRSRLGRRQMVAIVAAVLIFVLAAGFASGIFTAPIRFFNANEVWGSTSKAIAFGKEVNMLGLQTQLEPVKQRSLRGQIKEDVKKLIKEEKENGEPHWYLAEQPDGSMEKVYDDYYLVEGTVQFDSQDAAIDYIGCKYFEVQYFPYEKILATVAYGGMLENTALGERSRVGCGFSAESIDEEVKVKISAEVNWSDSVCEVGGEAVCDDGTFAVETFTNANGYNGGKIYKTGIRDGWVYSRVYRENGKPDVYEIRGLLVKNLCVYRIEISSPWEDIAEANRIFDTWAESF